jgi:rRNA-processing protein FCF1
LNLKAKCHNESILSEYKDVFEGIGLFPGECDICIDEHIATAINSPRRISFALREKLQTELERMEKCEVITRVTEPTEWVNSLAITEKPGSGKLRVALIPATSTMPYLGLITP